MVGDLVLLDSKRELMCGFGRRCKGRIFSPSSSCGVEKDVNMWDNKETELKKG